MKDIVIRLAEEADLLKVHALYESLKGTPGCAWDENYPTLEDARLDMEAGGLYVACDGDKIVGAVTAIPPEPEEDDEIAVILDCWDKRIKNPCDAARLGVLTEYQGEGIARSLISHIIEDVKRRGYDGLLFAVSKDNPRAMEIYRSMGADFCGEFNLWDEDMYSCQFYLGPDDDTGEER